MINQLIEKIRKQQGKDRTPVWMVGEQLIDICRHEPKCAEILAQDLENKSMSLENAEKKIKAFADSRKTGNFSCVTPTDADRILREFYGLPTYAPEPEVKPIAVPDVELPSILNFEDLFLGR